MGNAARQQDTQYADAWLTLSEAAEYTRMSHRALQGHIADGTLRPDSRSRPGFRLHRFRRSTLDRFLTGENDNG